MNICKSKKIKIIKFSRVIALEREWQWIFSKSKIILLFYRLSPASLSHTTAREPLTRKQHLLCPSDLVLSHWIDTCEAYTPESLAGIWRYNTCSLSLTKCFIFYERKWNHPCNICPLLSYREGYPGHWALLGGYILDD